MIIQLKNVRLSFPDLFVAKPIDDSPPAFGCNFLMPPDDVNVTIINGAMDEAAEAKWGAKGAGILAQLKKADKVCLHDGDAKDYDGYAGNLFLSARRREEDGRPLVIDRNKAPLVAADGRPYSGCYVMASVEIWGQDNSFGKRINATLRAVQFYKDGDAFSGSKPATTDEFEDLSEGADAPDLA